MSNEFILFEELLQCSVLMHFVHNVSPTNQFTLHKKLWVGWPFTVHFYLFSDNWVLQNINGFVLKNACAINKG